MTYRLAFIFISYVSIVCGSEYRIITTEHSSKLGMFASANQVLGQLSMFEAGRLPDVSGLVVDFETYGLYYDPSYGPNWWGYYFEPVCVGDRENATEVHPTKDQYLDAWAYRRTLTREMAADIVRKYIHVKAHVQQKIDDFVERYFQGKYVIGIHYRGTDKSKEAPRIAYKTVFEEVEGHIPPDAPFVLFIATDEASFLERAQERYAGRVAAIEAHRSENDADDLGIHFHNKNSYVVGEEALMDACLLSKCDLLIRTSSNLSLWSTYFNPDLPAILLNQRYMESIEPE